MVSHNTLKKRLILLARVSTPQQAKLYSLDAQIEEERSYAESIGAEVVAEIRDDQSGRSMARDGLQQALEMLECNEADGLVTYKFDRLHLNYVDSVVLRDRLRRMGEELHYAQARMQSGERARDRLSEDLQLILSIPTRSG